MALKEARCTTLGSTSGKVYGRASADAWLPFAFGSRLARGAGSAHVLKGGMALVRALVHLWHNREHHASPTNAARLPIASSCTDIFARLHLHLVAQ